MSRFPWPSPARAVAARLFRRLIVRAAALTGRHRDLREDRQLERAIRRNGLSVLVGDDFPARQGSRARGHFRH